MRSNDLLGLPLSEGDLVLSIPRSHESPLIIGKAVKPFPEARWKGPWMIEEIWNDSYVKIGRRRLLANRFFVLRKADDSVPDTLLGRLRDLGFDGRDL